MNIHCRVSLAAGFPNARQCLRFPSPGLLQTWLKPRLPMSNSPRFWRSHWSNKSLQLPALVSKKTPYVLCYMHLFGFFLTKSICLDWMLQGAGDGNDTGVKASSQFGLLAPPKKSTSHLLSSSYILFALFVSKQFFVCSFWTHFSMSTPEVAPIQYFVSVPGRPDVSCEDCRGNRKIDRWKCPGLCVVTGTPPSWRSYQAALTILMLIAADMRALESSQWE